MMKLSPPLVGVSSTAASGMKRKEQQKATPVTVSLKFTSTLLKSEVTHHELLYCVSMFANSGQSAGNVARILNEDLA